MTAPRHIAWLTIVTLSLPLLSARVDAQGCVAVRPMGCSTSQHVDASTGLMMEGDWEISSAYQYFQSFRHFRGDHEETHRVEEGTEVVNVNHAVDLGIGYGVNDRLSVTLNVPFIHYDRSSLYEHWGNSTTSNPTQARFHTGSQGLGDLRLTARYWLIDPYTAYEGNFAIGLGVKAPTGDSDVRDTFHKRAADDSDSLVTKAVDQSIQLGDGGWGFLVQGEGYRSVFPKGAVYFNAFYLFNPRDVNETAHNSSTYYSVADQFSARAGLSYLVSPAHGLSASLGGRVEGIPAEDLIGESGGRRRPGYSVSVEPGITYRREAMAFSLNVPVAVYRNRTQSLQDKQRTAETGEYRHGDAAFADYLVNFTMSWQFGSGGHPTMEPMDPVELDLPRE